MCIVSPQGLSGGLVVFWKTHVSVDCISHNARLVDLSIQYQFFKFYLSCVYGHPVQSQRKHLWEQLQRIATTRTGPWMMCGDFNEIRNSAEKKGGRIRNAQSFSEFEIMINVCGMEDLKYQGNHFSWVGNRPGGTVECCLDRVLVNTAWSRLYPASETEFLQLEESDHRPLLISIEYEYQRKRGYFRYDKRFFRDEGFASFVRQGWETRKLHQVPFLQNMKLARQDMARWKRNNRVNTAELIVSLREEIDQALRDGVSSSEDIALLRKSLNQAYWEDELFWKTKSRNKWLKHSDKNTKYFHGVTKARKRRTCIQLIQDDHGLVHTRDDAISVVAEEYFTQLFTSSHPPPLQSVVPALQHRVTPAMNENLIRPVTDLEICDAVFLIGADKAPGIDGFTASFYHQFWPEISGDVCDMVKRFFATGEMDLNINHTQLCLIPKGTEPRLISDYRPISLCTVSYKIISKIMVLRLKTCLGLLIAESQAAFVPGRNIVDNLLIAHELFHALKSKKDCSQQYVAIKTDISKAYDRVKWEFLESVMIQMGFHHQWITWIMATIRSVTYSVLINGSGYGHIVPTRGLRQGHPLSPYLFLLCAETLSQMVHSSAQHNQFQPMKLTRHCPPISHLFFTDDSLFFCRATDNDCATLAKLFHDYETVSGQSINYSKSSMIFGTRISQATRNRLHTILQIHKVGGGGKYLGVPEQLGPRKTETFQYLSESVTKTLDPWYNKFLSPTGKEVLIKSVALAKPIHTMNCFLVPKTVCDDINRSLSECWWGKDEGRRKLPWISLNRLASTKKSGGLGFRDLSTFNQALLGKQAWRLFSQPESLLARLYQGRYHRNSNFLDAHTPKTSSHGWKSIQSGKELLKFGLLKQLGNGLTTNIWKDHWLPTDPPKAATFNGIASVYLVNHLWKPGPQRDWDMNTLHTYLTPADVELASSINLSQYAQTDHYVWPYTTTGEYTVKSGYYLALQHSQEFQQLQPIPGDPILKQAIWKVQVSPIVHHFLWRALSEALAMATNLIQRHINADPICQRCCVEPESINHILFDCIHAQATWRCLGIIIPGLAQAGLTFEDNMRILLQFYGQSHLPLSVRALPFLTLWILWKSRNEFLFQKKNVHPHDESTRITVVAQEWIEAQQLDLSLTPISGLHRELGWEPPPTDYLKCNFDATYSGSNGLVTVGWIVRDSTGQHIASGCAKLKRGSSSLHAEMQGFLYVLQLFWVKGWRHVCFESDNKELVMIINEVKANVENAALLYDVRVWLNKFPWCYLTHVNREKNSSADLLAKHGIHATQLSLYFASPASWLIDSLYYPFTV